MKILHTSDWHLGMMAAGSISYREDQEYFINRVFDIADANKVDAIAIAGDIFDKSVASIEAIELYDKAMSHACNDLKIPVLVTAGNHDGAKRLSSCSAILQNSGLYIAGTLDSEPMIFTKGDADVYMLPWISTDRVKSAYPQAAADINSLADAYKVVLNDYRSRFVSGHKNILISHAFIINATTSVSDRAAVVGQAAAVPASLFSGFDYVALGHIHGPQNITESIVYSGSPMAYSFGNEENQTKGVVIYDTDNGSKTVIPIIPKHERHTLRGTYDELMHTEYDEDILGGYVRVELSDTYVGLETIAAFRERFPLMLEISGKSFENESAQITMTIDELEQAGTDSYVIFGKYCEDVLSESPSAHLKSLFEKALKEYESEVENS